ncbi:MAG: hypothetical protein ABI748_09800 [Dokdonella sp.]
MNKVVAPRVTKNAKGAATVKPGSKNRPEVARKPAAAAPIKRVQAPKAAVPTPRSTGPVSPEVAIQHFREVLRAKQERVNQGPSYPSANAFTGRTDAAAGSTHMQSEGPPAETGSVPEPEALNASNSMHGRGNQGMRNPK